MREAAPSPHAARRRRPCQATRLGADAAFTTYGFAEDISAYDCRRSARRAPQIGDATTTRWPASAAPRRPPRRHAGRPAIRRFRALRPPRWHYWQRPALERFFPRRNDGSAPSGRQLRSFHAGRFTPRRHFGHAFSPRHARRCSCSAYSR